MRNRLVVPLRYCAICFLAIPLGLGLVMDMAFGLMSNLGFAMADWAKTTIKRL